MPRTVDLNDAIRSLVQEAVEAALAPHLTSLERLQGFLGAPAGTAQVRTATRRNEMTGTRRARRARGALAKDRGDASRFEKGQRVQINVGRGQKVGKVVSVDTATNSVMVKRDDTGKEVKRPARGVQLA
jgi:hypothetical protein